MPSHKNNSFSSANRRKESGYTWCNLIQKSPLNSAKQQEKNTNQRNVSLYWFNHANKNKVSRSKDRYSPKSEYSGYVEDTYGYSPRVDQRCSTGTCSNRNADSKASSKSNKTSKSCSKCSSKGNKSLPTVSTSSAPSSSDIDTTNLSCSKCSSKFSSDTRITSFSSSAKSKPSGTDSLCNPLCQKSKSSSNYQTESVTSADIDDFRTIDPSNSRCENLGVALAQSPCGKILRARESSTCEAIRDPCKDVCCNLGNDPNVECTAIQEMLKNAECPSLIEYIDKINKIGGIDASPKLGHNRNFKSVEDPGKQRSKSAPGGSSAVDAAVIHEISTKVQNCLQHARAIAAKMGSSSQCRKTMRVRAKNLGPSSQDKAETVQVNSRIRLNTKGVAINNFTKVDKPFGRDPGIQVKLMDKQGHVEKFKKPYKDLLSEDASGTINIRICSPCKSTPGKLLCISTNRYPCCTGSPEASTSYKTSGNKVQPQAPDEETSEDDDEYAEPAPRSQDDSQNDGKGAVVVYKRPPKQSQQKKPSGVKGECSTNCGSCQKKSCPTSKYYKGRKKGGGKLQVYNVTTSHFCHNRNSPFIKGINVVDPKMFEQYTHPERHRAGESYMKKRREIIQRIKCKCPWYAHDPSHSNAYKSGNQREPCRKVQFDVDEL